MGPPLATSSASPDVTVEDPAICGSAFHVLVHVVPPTQWPPPHHGQCFTPAAGRAADVDTPAAGPAPAPTTHMRMLCPYCHAAILCSACSTGCRATCPSSHTAAAAVPMDADSASPPPPPPEPPPPHPQQQQQPPPPPPSPMEPPPPQQPAPEPQEQPAGEATVTPTPPAVTPTPPAKLPPAPQKTRRMARKPQWAPQPLDRQAHAEALAGGAHPGTFGAGPPFAPAGWEWSVGSRRTKSGAAFTDRYLRPSRDFMAEFGGPEPPGWRLDSLAGFKQYVAEHHPRVRMEDAVRAFAWRVPAAKEPEESESETETETESESEPEPEAPAPRKRKIGAAAAKAPEPNKPRKKRKGGAAAAKPAVPERRSLRMGVAAAAAAAAAKAAAGGTRRVWRGGRKPVKTVSVADMHKMGRSGAK